jgi:hypothetical protein
LTLAKTKNQIQTICFVDGTTGTDPAGSVTITYTDLFGGKWETRPITVDGTAAATTATNVAAALKALPNAVIPAVTVAAGTAAAAALPVGHGTCITVTFTDAANTGAQNLLTVNFKGCNRSGCSPKYSGLTTGDNGITVTVADSTTFSTTETALKEKSICSEHGLCDSATGLCKCFHGYYNLDCSDQTILV